MPISNKKVVRWIILAPILGFFAIQLVPAWLLQRNPPALAEPAWDSPATRALAQRACFDCHSNETVWPWYSRIAPASWLAVSDTVRGRLHLNFSEWGVASRFGEESRGEGSRELIHVLEEGEMPPASYLLLHPEAKLTADELALLVAGFEATFGR